MERKITVEFGRLFMMLLKKLWVFILIMFVFIAGGFLLSNKMSESIVTYSSTAKIWVSQESGESVGEIIDNASRIQPTYDTVELLKTGAFLKRVSEELAYDVTISELKAGIVIEQIPATRVININISADKEEKVKDMLNVVSKCAQRYLEEIMPEVKVVLLEGADSASIVQNQNGVDGVKIGFLMGMAVCMLVALGLIALYLLNDTIRYRDEAQEILGITVIGVISDINQR